MPVNSQFASHNFARVHVRGLRLPDVFASGAGIERLDRSQVHRDEVDHLFVRYRAPVFRFLRRFVRDGAAAEDLTQETFVRALGASYNANGYERAWVFQIARNLARDHLRAHARVGPTAALDDDHAAPANDPALALDLDAALATLGDDDREVFLLKEVGGLAYAEISAACGLTPDAVRSRLHRARLALRKQLT